MAHRKRRTGRSASKQKKGSNNTLVFKFVDPIVQSGLFIFFIYCLDTNAETPYPRALLFLLGTQLASFIINIFVTAEELLKKERLVFIFCLAAYLTGAYFIVKTAHRTVFELFSVELHATVLNVGILTGLTLISFWYFIICVREVRSMLPSMSDD